ncbi:hypothetical protein [Plesiomonas shigelloides]|uniref:hypothetical protein n=1 Tax=Plesiomonas shigelloides TaxID=703 RepID=UPI00326157C8
MLAIRHENSSTSQNVNIICNIIKDHKCERVTLFASPKFATDDTKNSDGPETNFPLVVALAEYSIPGITKISVVFDGIFLTAARKPRFFEIQELLDTCELSEKVFYSKTRAPFTSSLTAEEAVNILAEITPVAPLTKLSRADYFSLLSSFRESTYP